MNTRIRFGGMAVCMMLAAPLARAADHLNVKTGLWEITSDFQTSGVPPVPKELLDKMTAEQRAKILAAAQTSAARGHHDVSKECITEKDLQEPFRSDQKDCKQTVVTTTRTTQEIRMVCTGNPKGSGVLRINAPTSESMNGTMEMKMGDSADAFTVKGALKGKWLGADCGDEADAGDADDDEGAADDTEEEE